MDIGSLAEWISSVGTLAATAAAFAAARVALSEFRHGRDREKRADASRVHAWLAYDPDAESPVVVLQNLSPAPIYEVRVHLMLRGSEQILPSQDRQACWIVLPPGTYEVRPDPHYRWTLPEPIGEDADSYRPYTRSRDNLVIDLVFSDGHQVRWRRRADGTLLDLTGETSTDGSGAASPQNCATEPVALLAD